MYRVLVIDDDKLGRKGLISIIPWQECGMTVVGDVANGKLALDFLAENAVDLAVVDLSMPVMSGLEFIEASRAVYPNLQYVVLSFHEDFEYVQSALRFGALDYISKLRMEETDCVEVFRRVGNLLDLSLDGSDSQKSEQSAAEKAAEGISAEALEKLHDDWKDCHWIFSSEQFNSLIERLSGTPLTLRQAERLMMWISREIESVFELSCPVPFLTEVAEAASWLCECRRRLSEQATQAADHSCVSLCILQSVVYIRKHLTEHLKGEDIARHVGMSRSYFSVNFKNVTGYTYNDYLRCERIELAKRLLLDGSMAVSKVAEAVGYEDSKYFSRVFLEQTGVSCSELIKQKSLDVQKG